MIGREKDWLKRTGPETSIVANDKSGSLTWRILNGDFRKEYQKCGSLKECIKFFEKNKKYRSSWSTDSKKELEKFKKNLLSK